MFKKLRLRWKLHRWRKRNPHMHIKVKTIEEFKDVSKLLGHKWMPTVEGIAIMGLSQKVPHYVCIGFLNVKNEHLYKQAYGKKHFKQISYKKFKELFNVGNASINIRNFAYKT